MGLTYSVVELPLLTLYATTLTLLQFLKPRKSLSGKCFHPAEAAVIWDEEWEMDSIKPGRTIIIEGSTNDGKSIYIEVVTHDDYNTATVVLDDSEKTMAAEFSGPSVDKRTIKCGPLFLEMREPFRRWRVTFKGYLENNGEKHFVSIAGWWKATSDARYNNSDLAYDGVRFTKKFELHKNMENIARAHFSDDLSHFGVLHAEVCVDSVLSEQRFRGIRQYSSYSAVQTADEFYVYLEDANRIAYKSVSSEGHSVGIHHGFMEKGSLLTSPVYLFDEGTLAMDNHRLIDFHTTRCTTLMGVPIFSIRKGELMSSYSFLSSSGHMVEIKRIKVNHALTTGYALLRSVRESLNSTQPPEFLRFPDVKATLMEKTRMVVPFTLKSCQDKEFAGGKGANLAKLKTIESNYSVPNGAVITTAAFNHFLEGNNHMKKLVSDLGASGLPLEAYVSRGEKIMEAIKSAEPPTYLVPFLEESGITAQASVKYAVRSSAVGEDGSDLSSAGQLESVLNVPFNEIPEKILECWSSNFRKEVITYRRSYGQLLNPPMAVVVQEMVTGGMAGVMFTCDPVKNDDGSVVINVIKGCGEDIVSGVVTPDEVVIDKASTRMLKPNNCCLDEDSLKRLLNVGLFLENIFGTAQDVEFVVRDGKVFLVQSRDVTGRDRESKFELCTEFDTATLTDREVYTTANVGEVAPVPMTALELNVTNELFDRTMTNMCFRDLSGTKLPRHTLTAFFIHGQRLLFNMGAMFLRQHAIIKRDRLPEISIAGCPIFTEENFKEAEIRYGPLPRLFMLKRLSLIARIMFIRSYRLLGEIKEEMNITENLTPKSSSTFENLMDTFQKQLMCYRNVLEMHSDASMFSSFTYIVVGTLIRGADHGDTTPEMLSDLANIFSNSTSHVLSADVPAGLRKLAEAIVEDGLVDEFLAADDHSALNVLKVKGHRSAEQIEEFLATHGHRGPKELYLRAEGWAENPDLLVVTMKTMIKSGVENKAENNTSTDQLVDSLKCKPTGFRRWMMKYMVAQAHRGVACRESAKSSLVKSVYEARTTAKLIAKLLYNKGLLPDEDLLFFMTMDELHQLYTQRSAKLIARAMRRRQVFSELEARQYPHVMQTNPEPLTRTDIEEHSATVSLTGTVVCEGKVVAKARVAINLEEAKDTQPGEILITRCTDICWSPFFPLIKGIVTEIGGLLSHGAVVAREYGLPSLIAVEYATSVFKTGDLVELDTNKGTISKIETSS